VDIVCGPARQEKQVAGEWWRGWVQLRHFVRTFVDITMYPQYNYNMIIKKPELQRKKKWLAFLQVGTWMLLDTFRS
jgi:hypothetical protein